MSSRAPGKKKTLFPINDIAGENVFREPHHNVQGDPQHTFEAIPDSGIKIEVFMAAWQQP